MTAGRPAGHEPANKGQTLPGTKKPAQTSSIITRELFDIVDASGISGKALGSKAGYDQVSLSQWKHGRSSPSISAFENVAEALGYRLALIPIDV